MNFYRGSMAIFVLALISACGGSSGGASTGGSGDNMTPTPPVPRVDPNIVASQDSITGPSVPNNTIEFSFGYDADTGNPIFTSNVDAATGFVEPFGASGTASYSGTYRVLSISNVTDVDSNLSGDDPVDDVGNINVTVTLGANPTVVGQGTDGNLKIDGVVGDTLSLTGTSEYNGISGTLFNIVTDARTIAGAVSGNDASGGYVGGFFVTPD